MSTPRHGKRATAAQVAGRILAVLLCLALIAGLAALAYGYFTANMPWMPAIPIGSTATTAPSTTTTTTAPPTTTTATLPTSVTGVDHYKQQQPKEWNLLLVNSWNLLPDGYEEATEYVAYDSQNKIDSRAKSALEEMLSAGREHGLWGILLYREGALQQQYFDAEVAEWMEKGYSESEATVMAATEVVRPGTSEHQTGLAVDILGDGYATRDVKFEETDGFRWLKEHCADYGFILRYPKGKEGVTGMEYEPWHYRYVGKEHAEEIMKRGMTLEEYLAEKQW